MIYSNPNTLDTLTQADRRRMPRVDCHYPALISLEGKNASQAGYSTIVNTSASGLYLHSDLPLAANAQIRIQARVFEKPTALYRPCKLICQGQVVRSDSRADGSYGVAVKISQVQFLSE